MDLCSSASIGFWLFLAWGGVGLTFLLEHVLLKAIRESRKSRSASAYIGGGMLSYEIVDQEDCVYRTIDRRFTMANLQIRADLTQDDQIDNADIILQNCGVGRTSSWTFPTREEPYQIRLQNEASVQDGVLQVSISGSSEEGPSLKTGNATLLPGDTTTSPPFIVRNTSTVLELHTTGITNATVSLHYSLSFEGVHPTITDPLNLRVVDLDIPSYIVRTNHLSDIHYDYGHISSNITWQLLDEETGNFITNVIGPCFSPPLDLTNGYYEVIAHFPSSIEMQAIPRSGKLYVVPVVLEPITTETIVESGATQYINPIYVVTNSFGSFRIEVGNREFISDRDIVWECAGVSFGPGGNTGREVKVSPNAIGDYTLKVHIKNFVGPTPQIKFRGDKEEVTPVFAWIVTDDDHAATTPFAISNQIVGVNEIFKQAAMRFEIHSIQTTNRIDWFTISDYNNFNNARSLCSITNNSGGLELYFVDRIAGSISGLRMSTGIVISTNGNARTMAHEIGHACGLKDIYSSSVEAHLCVIGLVTKEQNPYDWSGDNEEGYYRTELTQSNLVERLLMYGYRSSSKADLSCGDIYGVWYQNETVMGVRRKVWQISHAPVGLSIPNATRTPESR